MFGGNHRLFFLGKNCNNRETARPTSKGKIKNMFLHSFHFLEISVFSEAGLLTG